MGFLLVFEGFEFYECCLGLKSDRLQGTSNSHFKKCNEKRFDKKTETVGALAEEGNQISKCFLVFEAEAEGNKV